MLPSRFRAASSPLRAPAAMSSHQISRLLPAPEAPHGSNNKEQRNRPGVLPQVANLRPTSIVSWMQAVVTPRVLGILIRFFLFCSCRCTLETAGPGFDPLGLYMEGPSRSDSRSPLSTFFGVLSPVFGSSSGARKEKSSYGRGAAGCQFGVHPFFFLNLIYELSGQYSRRICIYLLMRCNSMPL